MPAERLATNATDPSADGLLLAWHEPGAQGLLLRGSAGGRVPGAHPAVGGGRLAVLRDGGVEVTATDGGALLARHDAPGADAVAVSAAWVVWRARSGERDELLAAALAGGAPRLLASADQLGRPALDGDRLAFHAAGRGGGRILLEDLASGSRQTVRRERRAQLLNPSLHGDELLYVRALHRRQEVRLGPLARRNPRRDELLWDTTPTGRRDTGHEPGARHERHGHPKELWPRPRPGLAATLWTTALAADAAYVTRLSQRTGAPPVAELLRVPR